MFFIIFNQNSHHVRLKNYFQAISITAACKVTGNSNGDRVYKTKIVQRIYLEIFSLTTFSLRNVNLLLSQLCDT